MSEEAKVLKAGDSFTFSDSVSDVVEGLYNRISLNLELIQDIGQKNQSIKAQAFEILREAIPETEGWEFSLDHENKQIVLMYPKK